MKNVQYGLMVKNMSYLILNMKYAAFMQIKKCKMTEREIFEKYDNLSEDKLNRKINKKVYVENDVMITVIKRCRGEKKRPKKNR